MADWFSPERDIDRVPPHLRQFATEVVWDEEDGALEFKLCMPGNAEPALFELWAYGDIDLRPSRDTRPMVESDSMPAFIEARSTDPNEPWEFMVYDSARHGHSNVFTKEKDLPPPGARREQKLPLPSGQVVVYLSYYWPAAMQELEELYRQGLAGDVLQPGTKANALRDAMAASFGIIDIELIPEGAGKKDEPVFIYASEITKEEEALQIARVHQLATGDKDPLIYLDDLDALEFHEDEGGDDIPEDFTRIDDDAEDVRLPGRLRPWAEDIRGYMGISSMFDLNNVELWYYGRLVPDEENPEGMPRITDGEWPALLVVKKLTTGEAFVLHDNARHGIDRLFFTRVQVPEGARPLEKLEMPPADLRVQLLYTVDVAGSRDVLELDTDGNVMLAGGGTMPWEEALLEAYSFVGVDVDALDAHLYMQSTYEEDEADTEEDA